MRKDPVLLVCFLCGIFAATICSASVVETTIPAGGDVSLYLGDGGGDDTGVRVFNDSPNPTLASIHALAEALPRSNETLSNNFRLLDNSLTLTTSTNIDGQMRVRARIRYQDSRLREQRMRKSRLRLFRLDPARRRWLPAQKGR